MIKPIAVAIALACCGPVAAVSPAAPSIAAASKAEASLAIAQRLDSAIAGAQRSPGNRARDGSRHPKETLLFFGLAEGQTVVEITPGGGWFTEVLAPALKGNGKLIAAIIDPSGLKNERLVAYLQDSNAKFREKLAADAAHYGEVDVVQAALEEPAFGEPGSADAVFTFRNVHNWTAWKTDIRMFKAFFAVLKPNGVLGVEEHRAAAGSARAANARSGYLTEEYVIGLATAAGFVLEEKSEINANPKDVDDHPNGVWTLPPSNRHDTADAAKYQAIGESDRMTLRFRKPNR